MSADKLEAAVERLGGISDLEIRAFHAANADWTVPQYQQLVRDLWKAACDGSECDALSSSNARAVAAEEALRPFADFYNADLSGLSDGIEVRLDASFAVQGEEARRRGGIRIEAFGKARVGDFRKAAQIVNRTTLASMGEKTDG